MAQEILVTLDCSQRPVRHESISEAHARTFSWALRGNKPKDDIRLKRGQGNLYQWLSSGYGMFWVSGKPGSGKSTFMKYVADHLETRRALSIWASPHSVIIASHYFWSAGTTTQRSQQGLWQSLLFEILSKIPEAIPEVCHGRWQLKLAHAGYVSGQDSWSTSELRSCFSRLAQQQSSKTRFCVFVDGLDEFDGDQLDIVQTLIELSNSPMIKLCVSSRPWNVFEANLGQSPLCKIYMHELTRDDILQFSESQLARHPRWAVEVGPVEADLLIKDIAGRAQGVFLWVFLVTKLLREGLTNDDKPSDLRNMLDSVPPDLEQFYKQMLDNVSSVYHEKMAGFLELALAAHKPLNASIYHFHEMGYDDVEYALKEQISPHDQQDLERTHNRIRRRLDAFCKGLLEVDTLGRVQYIHRTVKDWLRTAAMRSYLRAKVKPDFDPDLSIFRGYLAVYKHPPVGSEVDIFRHQFDTYWSGWAVTHFHEALSYVDISAGFSQAHATEDVYRILDEYSSVVVKLFRSGLVRFTEQAKCLPEADGVTMLRSHLLKSGLWGYLVHKSPDYFTPLVRCPQAIRFPFSTTTDDTQNEMALARSKVATSVLSLFLNEYLPEDITNPDGDPLNPFVFKNMAILEFLVISNGLLGQGADHSVTIQTAGSLQIPAWLGLFLLAFKLDSSEAGDLYIFLSSLLAGIDFKVALSGHQMGRISWAIICNHISALQGRSKAYDIAPQTSSVTEHHGQQRARGTGDRQPKFLFRVVKSLLKRLVQCRESGSDFHIPWRYLLVAINEGFSRRFAKRLSKRLSKLVPRGMEPDSGSTREAQTASAVGSCKRKRAEVPVCEPNKRTRNSLKRMR